MVPRIHLLDLKTRHVSTLPGSEGLFFPRLSPDGRFLVAMIVDSLKLLLFNIMTQRWRNCFRGDMWIIRRGREPGNTYIFPIRRNPALPSIAYELPTTSWSEWLPRTFPEGCRLGFQAGGPVWPLTIPPFGPRHQHQGDLLPRLAGTL